MKIFIQARKDGYNVLYPKPTPREFYTFASDIQSISADNHAKYYGKKFYTLAFTGGGCIFTQYVIGYDVQRNNLGNVGISVFVPNDKKISGADVKQLLDALVDTYCENYCPDYYICGPQNAFEWDPFTSLVNEYDAKLRNVSIDENLRSGTKDAAFVYYPHTYKDVQTQEDSTIELEDIFDNPYQEEFSEFRQILFVNKDWKDKPEENPLNVLRYSETDNLTGKIDYTPPYKLQLNEPIGNNDLKIEVYVAGNKKCDKNKIRKKDEIEIVYNKKYHKPISKKVILTETDSNEYIRVDEAAKTIQILPVELEKETKDICFKITDTENNPIQNVRYKKEDESEKKLPDNSTITFIGDEMGMNLTIKFMVVGDNYKCESKQINPSQIEDEVPITLHNQKIIEFDIQDKENGIPIPDFKLNVKRNRREIDGEIGRIDGKKVYFWGKSLKNKFSIQISANDYLSKEIECNPISDSQKPIDVKLERKSQNKKYYLKIDEKKGKRSCKGKNIPGYVHENPIHTYPKCDSHLGYKFKEWKELSKEEWKKSSEEEWKRLSEEDGYDGCFEAIFIESCMIVLVAVINKVKSKLGIGDEIENYLKSDEDLDVDKVKTYLDKSKDTTLRASLKLCLEFWSLDGNENASYSSFLEELNKDPNLRNSELKNFVEKMSNQATPKYPKNIPGVSEGTIKTLTQLKQKLKEI
jgi:hypothetical protein